ncbi:glycerophosphoryl diester phosphodiesterase [Virgibacillus litoralis]|uniref:Glycerophosphoryl diester phosphodiesterase n=2 Tax=Virgibacillus litoralis TaxID=578221 RepID=A0ABS4HAH9_9BACI|nr:glycerophosphoryl diester phosphodiesterase [Virgibacillus litoralis]
MSAFKKAVELNADMLELDVHLTQDEQVVVYHDFYLEKNTNGNGFIGERTVSEINKLDIKSSLLKGNKAEKIPLLEEVLAWAKDKVWINIELKQMEFLNEPLAKKVVGLVEYYQMEDQVQLMSFNHKSLLDIRKYNKKIMTNAISASLIVNPIGYLDSINAQVLNTPIIHLSPSIIGELHNAGFLVHGSMSDSTEVCRRLLEWNVDAMDTNVPDIMIEERTKFLQEIN